MEKVKTASLVLNQFQQAVWQYLVAIVGIMSPDEGSVEGTGTIIELGGRVLLVTAEHVISQIEAKGYLGVAFSNGNNKAYTCAPGPFIKHPPIDVAFVCIPRPELPASDRLVCPERLIGRSSTGVEKDLLFIDGFPGNDSKFWQLLKGIRSKTFTFAAYAGVSKWAAFDPAIHFAIRFEPNHCIGIDGKSADMPIPPDGLSGTAVWNMRRKEVGPNWTPEDGRVVGIVQRWDPDGQCLIATRIEHILPFVRTWGLHACQNAL